MLGILTVGPLEDRFPKERIVAGAFLAGGLSLVAVSFAITGVTVLIASFAVGLTFAWKKIPIDTMVQEALPDGYRGRVFAAYDVVYNLARVIAAAVAIPMLPHVGVSGSVAVVGILFLLWTPVLPRWIGGKPPIVLRFAEGAKAEEWPRGIVWGGVEEPVDVVRSWNEERDGVRMRRFRLSCRTARCWTSAASNRTACGASSARPRTGSSDGPSGGELLVGERVRRDTRRHRPADFHQSPPIPATNAHGGTEDEPRARSQVLGERAGDDGADRRASEEHHAVERHHASAELGQRPELQHGVRADDEDHHRESQGDHGEVGQVQRGRERGRRSAAPDAIDQIERRRKSGAAAGELARFAMINAAANAPSPVSADMTPNVAASPSNVRFASNGSRTAQLNANVNTIVIRTSGRRSSGVVHT
jgi:hypothetical protein